MIAVVVLAAAILVLDQITKLIALDRLPLGVAVPVIDGLLSLTLVLNPGLAFGLLGSIPLAWRWVVAARTIISPVWNSWSNPKWLIVK